MTKCDYCNDEWDVECHGCHDGEDVDDKDYEIVYRNQHDDYDGLPVDKGEEVYECKCGKCYHRSWHVNSGGAGGDNWVD